MVRFSLSMLGSFQATLDGEPVTAFESDKARALLAYLAVESDRPHRREMLAGLLWPERIDRVARGNLRVALSRLRDAIGDRSAADGGAGEQEPLLSISRDVIQFNRASDHWLDVAVFADALTASREHRHRDLETCAFCAVRLEKAAAVYRGDFLAGFSLDSVPFEEWLVIRREEFHRQALDVLHHLAAYHHTHGEHEQAIDYARRQTELEPWNERAHRQWMRALAAVGQRAAALAQYEACRRILEEELGVEPGPETEALYERVRDGTEEPAALIVTPHNLPVPLIPFVGREQSLAEIRDYFADPACRLLTLVGPGGSGKTRLAVEAARNLAEVNAFCDGVYYVSLAPLQSVEAMVPTITGTLGLSLGQSAMAYPGGNGARAATQQLLDYLREKEMLLVLDNLEHLLEGMGLLSELLAEASEVRVLVTSRVGLDVQGECRFQVTGLAYPTTPGAPSGAEDLLEYSAVRLFVQSAARLRPGMTWAADDLHDVARICRLVQGMPLGILLAAAWVEVLSVTEIADLLSGESLDQPSLGLDLLEVEWSDVPERQRSMRSVFDHSWRLLSAEEREVLAGMSVFRGGLARDAAQQVTRASLRDLRTLINWSLLHRTPEGRYEMHELLRQYAWEVLQASGDAGAAVRDRHAAHYVAAWQRWEPDLKSARQRETLVEIEADLENARIAWDWALERGQYAGLSQVIDGLCGFYRWRGRYLEAEALCRDTVDRLGPSPDPLGSILQAKALAWQGVCSNVLGRRDLTRELYERSLALLDRLELTDGDVRRAKAFALCELGMYLHHHTGTTDDGQRLTTEGLALYRAAGDSWGTARALWLLGWMATHADAYEEAKQLHCQSLTIRRELGLAVEIADSLIALGRVARSLGEHAEAAERTEEAVALYRETGQRSALAWGLLWQAELQEALGDYAGAGSLAQQSSAILEDLGFRLHMTSGLRIQGWSEVHLGRYEQARTHLQASLAQAQELEDRRSTAWALSYLGAEALARQAYGEAFQTLEESVANYRETNLPHELGSALAYLGITEWGLGRADRARQCLAEALLQIAGTRDLGTVVALGGMALLLAQHGEGARAVELYALASQDPRAAHSRWWCDAIGQHIALAAASMPADVVASAKARGQARDLWTTAEELLKDPGVW